MKIKHGMILAAGLGKRMQPLTLKTPKPLLKIGNKTLLERSINLLINHGIEEIVINIHHLGQQIEQYISESEMPEEYRDMKSEVICNDCEVKTITKFHFMYHKCNQCNGWNTNIMRTFKDGDG